MRWRQDRHTGEFIPIDESARTFRASAIHGDIQSFVSPVDGTVITDRKQLREHNKRNNVVSASEFDQNYYDGKAKERSDFFQGKHDRKETLERKQELYEKWTQLEREDG